MPTSDLDPAPRRILLGILLAANVLLLGSWAWLEKQPLGADSSDPPVKVLGEGADAAHLVSSESVFRNTEYLAAFGEAIRRERGIMLIGTSETLAHFNLGSQLNALYPANPPIVVFAKSGSSPIHSALLFANCRREGIPIPPLVLMINLVYFSESHDVINDGWMASVMRSDVFVMLNHRHVLDGVSPETRAVYESHAGLRRFLLPFYAEEYLGNLVYLSAHEARPAPVAKADLPIERYRYDGEMPDYDKRRGVHSDYVASDQMAKGRWEVKRVGESVNLIGLESTAKILAREKAPSLLIVLPVNRRFYASNGLDMAEFDRRYAAIRAAIGKLEAPGKVSVIDLYDSPWLDLGFADRMHADAYGFHQIAEKVGHDPKFEGFVDSVRRYYGDAR